MNFFEHLETYLSKDEIARLQASLLLPNQHALLLNESKISKATLLDIYPSLIPHPIINNAFLYDKNELDLGKSIYHELGCFYLQEPSAMLPAYLLQPQDNDLVLDLCAAPGGKSMQASMLMHNTGLIIANDIAKNRAFAISENSERLGRGNLLITSNNFSTIYQYFLNTFDKIILDAPCSGSGMFRKMKEMQEDWSCAKVEKYAEVQKELILIAYSMLKEGGQMVYSTCSFSEEEDEQVIEYLLNNSDAIIEQIEVNPLYFVNPHKPLGVHLLPSLFPGEGHYICLIKKPGQLKKNTKHNKNSKPLNIPNNGYEFYQKYGDYLYLASQEFNTKYLNVIRYGVKVGMIDKNDIRYDYHYAHFINDFDNIVEISQEELQKYYLGESINRQIAKGYVLLKYQGINVDIAKSDGRIIKNRLPKGLRKKLNF